MQISKVTDGQKNSWADREMDRQADGQRGSFYNSLLLMLVKKKKRA